jgi:hypothetical protein
LKVPIAIKTVPTITNTNQKVPSLIKKDTNSPSGDGREGFSEAPTANLSSKKMSPINSKKPKTNKAKPIIVTVFRKLPLQKNYSFM